MIAIVLVVVKLRKVHEMRPAAIFLLTLSAGVTWPLLVIAALQGVGLLVLANGLGAGRARRRRVVQAADDPAPMGFTAVARAACHHSQVTGRSGCSGSETPSPLSADRQIQLIF